MALGAASLGVSLGSFAQQQGKVWRVGVLSARRRPASFDLDYYGAFPRRMSELGYVEGRNLLIEWRFADGDYERLPGLSNLAGDLSSQHLEMLLTMVPKLARIGILVNSANSAHGAVLKNVQAAAQKASITVLPVKAQTPQEIESAFSLLTRESAGAVIVTLDPLFISIGMRGVVSVVPTRARLPVNQRLC